MNKFKTSDLKAGMAFDHPVYIDADNVLVQAKQPISTKDIERLTKWGISEVETKGQPISMGTEPVASATTPDTNQQATASTDTSLFDRPDDELKAIITNYKTFRNNKKNFKRMLSECATVLETNIQTLYEKKTFKNQEVIQSANQLTTEITEKNLLLILFHATNFTRNWQIQHSIHAASYCVLIGQALEYSKPRLQELMFASLLMDTGMFSLPAHIREKADKLSDAEMANVKAHPLIGYQLLMKEGKVKSTLATVALQHQETYNGKGYPQNLKAGQIEEIARIAHIADFYTAMIERRPYRKAVLPYDAMKTMLSVEMHSFDPKLLRLFLGLVSIYPIGSLVKLNNGFTGLVVACKPDKPLRPILRLMRDGQGLPFNDLYFLDLVKKTDLYIVNAIAPAAAGIHLEAEI